MHEKLLRLCFFAERCVILEVNKIRQPPGCSKGVNEIMKEYAFGIDLGGTTAKIGLFTTAGALLEKWEVPTDTSNAGEHILENLAAAIMGKMQEKAIPAEQVAVGDVLRVLPGETVPVDGEILTGQTSINQAVMTGESLPVDKGPGDEVSSGTVNQFGAFEMRATKVGEDSSIQRMIRLVQSADAGKARVPANTRRIRRGREECFISLHI